MFTSCTNYPIMTNNLKIVSEDYKNHPEFLMISFSVTPWIDSIPKLNLLLKVMELLLKTGIY